MFLPVSTDAPVYHWPWVTLSLIVTNIGAFVLNTLGLLPGGEATGTWGAWALHFGGGLRPLEWISCHFVHFDVMHLLGNMIFLWVFGLVVEGKTGWRRYLLIYFGCGIFQACVAQLLMLGADDPRPAGGASGVVYCLMAISLVWAPKNEVSLLCPIWYRGIYFEMTILALAGFYIVMQAAFALAGGFVMSAAVLHLLGAVTGFAVGAAMVKRGWVDCENWDLFAVMKGTHGSPAVSDDLYFRDDAVQARLRGGAAASASNGDAGRAQAAFERMQYSLQRGRPAAALAEYGRALAADPDFPFLPEAMFQLADSLCEARMWNEAGPLLERLVETQPDAPLPRLKLAALLVEIEQRPKYALRVLEPLAAEELDERLARRLGRIETRARQMIGDGVLEPEGRGWQ